MVTLVAVLALTMTVSAVATLFKQSVSYSTEAGQVSLARLQALYLAEMGINEALFRANLNPSAAWPAATPQTLDFKADVALVRAEPTGSALVVVGPAAADPARRRPPFEARARLTCAAGVFEQVVYFDVGRAAAPPPGQSVPQWTLARYVAEDFGGPR